MKAESVQGERGFVTGRIYTAENYDKIDLHRPYVDDIVLVSESGKPMRRESDLNRRMVRLGCDALRADTLSVREQGVARQSRNIPGRLHCRRGRSNPRMVLHPACHRHNGFRQRRL